ncbi:OmpA family protein [Parahaliea mediterranea]|uniref:OmpA family protein n=1 Tax=Parahaliea mediterranea TaxID=651086 RepID=UPI000E2EEDD3|nr:OmpA family protein [Parahaliea mediterranea]
MSDLQDSNTETPVWAIFGDLMAALVGVFVLILVWVIGYQLELARDLAQETERRQVEQQRRQQLEDALAGPLAEGRISLRDGRIGISGSVLFALNSADLQAEGRSLLASLAGPLQDYLAQREELLMVSGFTDDLPIQRDNRYFDDNWELSAQRALTVTRALIEEGMPASLVFASAFGEQQPVAANSDEAGRARNRRVEMAPVPKLKNSDS